MELRRDQIAVRKIYEHLVRSRELTTFFRPGDREFPHPKSYEPREVVDIKILEVIGSDFHKILPIFTDESFPVKIISVIVKDLSDLTRRDFIGSSPDIQNRQSLVYHLGALYNHSLSELQSSKVTRAYVEYI
ncbi:MAG: hypothetical protein QGF74_01790 [Candidatus Nanoarchaeia archaeon]|jgi:hypothetical protein|nr:hypothetical protein [Candidatus Nanoarchaeia archaeon]|tara:strand:- start:12169 stop:12564 length:396 start_codon:yes stop_codon:yes gene_type:complete